MAITRNDRIREFLPNGAMIRDDAVVVDITAEATRADIVAKARAALTANATFQAIGSPSNAQTLAQVRLLTREMNGLIRLLGAVLPELLDLLVENTDT